METKTSQVSFKYTGDHNTSMIVRYLIDHLLGFVYTVEKESRNVYRMYVASSLTDDETYKICFGIQSNVVYDYNRELTLT